MQLTTQQIDYCMECGVCTGSCPISYERPGFSPRQMIKRTLVEPDETILQSSDLWACLSCSRCSDRCPVGIDFPEFIRSYRHQARVADNAPRLSHHGIFQTIATIQTAGLQQNRTGWATSAGTIRDQGDYFYFVGCAPFHNTVFRYLDLQMIDTAASILTLLNKVGIEPVVSNDERCCGHDAYWSGNEELFATLARKNVETIVRSGAKTVIFGCPEGYAPQENILYFLEKNAPLLQPWQREVIRIVRKIAQYFYPQRQTQVMNEGWACFWHYTIMNHMYDEGLINDATMLEFLHTHTNVIAQPDFDSPYYSGINPYALGFKMMMDIRRICEDPTDEDLLWFPDIANSDWQKTLDFAMRNFKDESFIGQYLSPRLIREFRLFAVLDDERDETLGISAIHDDVGYRRVREKLSAQYNLSNREPNLQVYNVDHQGDRKLTLRYYQDKNRPLSETTDEVIKHLHRLWGFDVEIETLDDSGDVEVTHYCPTSAGPELDEIH